jgi:hypothetical protein
MWIVLLDVIVIYLLIQAFKTVKITSAISKDERKKRTRNKKRIKKTKRKNSF